MLLLYVVWTGKYGMLWLLWMKRGSEMSAYEDEVMGYSSVNKLSIQCLHI